MITWDESFATGEIQIDEQHQTLFNFINLLSRDIAAGKPPEILKNGLDFLENYARTHFAYEGLCMHRLRCPVADENDKAHRAFLDFLDEFKLKLEKEGFTTANVAELQVFIEEWIVRHIRRIDTKLRPCVERK